MKIRVRIVYTRHRMPRMRRRRLGREKTFDGNESDLFEGLDTISFPALEHRPPPKTYKQQKLEEERERTRLIQWHERRFEENSTGDGKYVTDDQFMVREPGEGPAVDSELRTKPINIFKEDMDSYKEMPNYPVPPRSVLDEEEPLSAYEYLNQPRAEVSWSKRTIDNFAICGKVLEKFMDDNDIKRAANAMKRMAKAEKMDVRMKRFTANQIKRRMEEGIEDLFGFHCLIPHALTKSDEDGTERKKKLLHRFKDQMFDFDYLNRPHARERAEGLADFRRKKAEYEQLEKEIKRNEARKTVLQKKIAEQRAQEAMEVDADVLRDEPVSNTIALMETTTRRSVEDSIEQNARQIVKETDADRQEMKRRQLEKELEERKKNDELRKRREAVAKREEERAQIAAKIAEEARKRKEAEQEEQNRRREERLREEEEERREEERKEKERRYQEEIERAIDAEKKKKEVEKLNAEELEKMKKDIEEKRKDLDQDAEAAMIVSNSVSSPDISEANASLLSPRIFQRSWNFHKIAKLAHWKARQAEKFRQHFKLPCFSDFELEKSEAMAEFMLRGTIVIPQENNANTSIFPVCLPSKKLPPPPPPKPSSPADVAANEQETMTAVKKLKKMLTKTTTKIVDLWKDEVDYEQTRLNHLKPRFIYPFRPADGLYWPLFFVCDSDSIGEPSTYNHVEALAVCNSFSGKYASHLLLTTHLSEDEPPEKKFEDAYADSDGDFATYSQKPGRFEKRFGYRAHMSKCSDSFEVQKQRARETMRQQYAEESRRDQEFKTTSAQYKNDKTAYDETVKIHLRHLVEEARIDVYSMKEDYAGHPGTRRTHIDPSWHTHGYNLYASQRNEFFASYMSSICQEYENECPPPHFDNTSEFEEWCFAPMLASLYYQITHDPFHVFPKEKMKILEERRRKYSTLLLKETRFSLKDVQEVCQMDESDNEQWTFLLDQLASHFKAFPTVSAMIYKQGFDLYAAVLESAAAVMSGAKKDVANNWGRFAH